MNVETLDGCFWHCHVFLEEAIFHYVTFGAESIGKTASKSPEPFSRLSRFANHSFEWALDLCITGFSFQKTASLWDKKAPIDYNEIRPPLCFILSVQEVCSPRRNLYLYRKTAQGLFVVIVMALGIDFLKERLWAGCWSDLICRIHFFTKWIWISQFRNSVHAKAQTCTTSSARVVVCWSVVLRKFWFESDTLFVSDGRVRWGEVLNGWIWSDKVFISIQRYRDFDFFWTWSHVAPLLFSSVRRLCVHRYGTPSSVVLRCAGDAAVNWLGNDSLH